MVTDVPPRSWIPPVPAVVVERPYRAVAPFRAGGHRSLRLRAAPGEAVRAPCGGTVSFRGAVGGGPPVLTIDCGSLRATLSGVLAAPNVGTRLARGAVVAISVGPRIGLSARVPSGAYRDPLPLLGTTAGARHPVAVPARRPDPKTPGPAAPAQLPASALVRPASAALGQGGAQAQARRGEEASSVADRPVLLAGAGLVLGALTASLLSRRPNGRGAGHWRRARVRLRPSSPVA